MARLPFTILCGCGWGQDGSIWEVGIHVAGMGEEQEILFDGWGQVNVPTQLSTLIPSYIYSLNTTQPFM